MQMAQTPRKLIVTPTLSKVTAIAPVALSPNTLSVMAIPTQALERNAPWKTATNCSGLNPSKRRNGTVAAAVKRMLMMIAEAIGNELLQSMSAAEILTKSKDGNKPENVRRSTDRQNSSSQCGPLKTPGDTVECTLKDITCSHFIHDVLTPFSCHISFGHQKAFYGRR